MAQQQFKFDGSQTIFVVCNNGNRDQEIGPQQFLEGKLIVAVAYHGHMIKSDKNVSVLGATSQDAKNMAYITLKDTANNDFINRLPLRLLDPVIENTGLDALASNPHGPLVLPQPMRLSIRDSYVTIADTSKFATAEVIPLTFYYINGK